MATTTPVHLLRKPEGTDLVNVLTDIAENAEDLDAIGGRQYGLARATSEPGALSAETDIPGFSITYTVPIANRKYRLFSQIAFEQTVATDTFLFRFYRGATALVAVRIGLRVANLAYLQSVVWTDVNPAIGAHTYKATIARETGTGTFKVYMAGSEFSLDDVGRS